MKQAVIYRMVMPNHICPFGTKSVYLLKQQGFDVEDHWLTSREATEKFKAEHNVKTTPQTFIDKKRVGGYDELRQLFGKSAAPKKGETSYLPVIWLFAAALLMAISITWSFHSALEIGWVLRLFGGLSMCLLAVQKLRDPFSYSNMFLNYDLLAMRFVPYAYIYMLVELVAGIGMLSGVLPVVTGAATILIGGEGAASVVKAVYIDKRELKCACMGGDSNVPLGFISLTENLLMIAMGAWMLST